MTKVSFFGAAGEVTGSNFLIETEERKYVVDCGLFQGSDQNTEHNDEPLAYNAEEIEAVVVTHAHLDHIGRLPVLVKNGFKGPIYMTAATAELTGLVLKDAFHIMMSNFERREGEEQKPMLYEEADLNRTLDMFKPIPYHKPQTLFGEDSVTLFDAGHILGSSSALVRAGEKTLVFSGDLGHWPNTLLPHPDKIGAADMVITEATYGGVEREKKQDKLEVIKSAIDWVQERHGVLLIPAFSVERSQELLYLLHELNKLHQLPHMPIYFDSPLGIEALEVFKHHQELYSAEVKKEESTDREIFDFSGLVITPTSDESKEINDEPPPKIIIAGSGMMDGGRIAHHLKRYISHPNTLLLVVGYQAEGTLGRAIVDGAKEIMITDDRIPVHAKVEVVDIFSGHADNDDLIEWLKNIHLSTGGKVVIVHSDPDRSKVYCDELKKIMPQTDISVAVIGESVGI